MGCRVVIVESRAKARTLRHQLGSGYVVLASGGRVRELPKDRLGIDVARGFAPEYEVPPARRRDLAELRRAVKSADEVYLAADPDAEGEAVCWHLEEELAGRGRPSARFHRVAFHEITPRAVALALGAPRGVDPRRVDAEQARLVLDRLVGNALGPLHRHGAGPALPVGRLPSVALRIVCDREREIEAFSPRESWDIRARLAAGHPPPFAARLVDRGGRRIDIATAADAAAVRALLERAAFQVRAVRDDCRRQAPPPSFVTATLLEESHRRLGFSVKKTMRLAERLYEGVDLGDEGPVGLITHVRTGSPRVPSEAAAAAREHVARTFGPAFVPDAPRSDRTTQAEGGSDEAIRPTDVERTKQSVSALLGRDELALYALVCSRFVASQMAPAVRDERIVNIEARAGTDRADAETFLLRAKASHLRFSGFLAACEQPPEDVPEGTARPEAISLLPPLEAGETLSLVALEAEPRLTEPPPRFSEASLVRELERSGIGRPATYAGILATLQASGCVERRAGRLRPTRLGLIETDLLASRIPGILSVSGAAAVEASLDAIEDGRDNRLRTLTAFWKTFEREIGSVRQREPAARPAPLAETDDGRPGGERIAGTCPECGGALVRRSGRYGPLVGCRRYPACRYLQRRKAPAVGVACPDCHEGEVVERAGGGNRTFYACSRYPACRFTSNHRPVAESCPECGRPYLLERTTRREGRLVFCANEACRHRRTG